jgi:hypothetical protein
LFTKIFGTTFGCCARKTPDVVALVVAGASIAAPRAAARCRDHCVAPLASTWFAFPGREWATDALLFKHGKFTRCTHRCRPTPRPAWFTRGC